MFVFAPTLFGQIASRPTDQIVRVSLRMRDRTVSGRKQMSAIDATTRVTADWLCETKPVVHTGRTKDQPLMADPFPIFQQVVKAFPDFFKEEYGYVPDPSSTNPCSLTKNPRSRTSRHPRGPRGVSAPFGGRPCGMRTAVGTRRRSAVHAAVATTLNEVGSVGVVRTRLHSISAKST